jgi:[protein-PII] uridylyltransferase
VTAALAAADLDVRDAVVATWADGAVVESFTVTGPRPDPDVLRTAIATGLDRPLTWRPAPDTDVDFDGDASPWHTVCEVRAADRPALLLDVTAALAAAGVEVVAAGVHADDGLVVDRFDLVGRGGAKLTPADRDRVRRLLHDGPRRAGTGRIARVRRRRSRTGVPADRP